MEGSRVLVTGFGPFEAVSENPSGRLALEVDGQQIGHRGAVTTIVGAVLPVSFEQAPRELEVLVDRIQPRAVLSMGVHSGSGLRLERGARAGLRPDRPDADGVSAQDLPERAGPWMESSLSIERLAGVLEAAGTGPVELSEDAGQYVCECVYRKALEIGRGTGTPSLFLHVPGFEHLGFEEQRSGLLALLAELVLVAGGASR